MSRPFGLGPAKFGRAGPFRGVTVIETSVHAPASWSLRVFCCAVALPGSKLPSAITADVPRISRRFMSSSLLLVMLPAQRGRNANASRLQGSWHEAEVSGDGDVLWLARNRGPTHGCLFRARQ